MPLRLICSVSLPASSRTWALAAPTREKAEAAAAPVPISCSISRRDAAMTILLWRSFRLP